MTISPLQRIGSFDSDSFLVFKQFEDHVAPIRKKSAFWPSAVCVSLRADIPLPILDGPLKPESCPNRFSPIGRLDLPSKRAINMAQELQHD